jgi:gamma-glutamyl phosphate reductase
MRHDLTIVCGYYNEHVNKITGEIVKKADSISFANMDDIQFSELYEKTKDVICKWLGIDNEAIDEEINQYY